MTSEAVDWPLLLTASSADYYFDSYNHYGVHEDILRDNVTMQAYQAAILQNPHIFAGKVVLEVSAGLGFCSLMAAKAGARRVIALESQPELCALGAMIALRNGFTPDVLQFVCERPSSLDQLPDGIGEVDIIVSLWMGYFLMYEARLSDVIDARQKWLKADGLMFPSRAKLNVALMEDRKYERQHFDYFSSVWGFDYSSLKEAAHREPVVGFFDQGLLLSSEACVLDLDLTKCCADDCLHMASQFRVSCFREGTPNAVLSWFEIHFDECHKPVHFSTGPESLMTCWKQTAFFFSSPAYQVKNGEQVSGMIAVKELIKGRRHLDVKIALNAAGSKSREQYFRWT